MTWLISVYEESARGEKMETEKSWEGEVCDNKDDVWSLCAGERRWKCIFYTFYCIFYIYCTFYSSHDHGQYCASTHAAETHTHISIMINMSIFLLPLNYSTYSSLETKGAADGVCFDLSGPSCVMVDDTFEFSNKDAERLVICNVVVLAHLFSSFPSQQN